MATLINIGLVNCFIFVLFQSVMNTYLNKMQFLNSKNKIVFYFEILKEQIQKIFLFN